MEEDTKSTSLRSAYLQQSSVKLQIDRLEAAVDNATELLGFETAHNPEILYAIDIIEYYINSKKRVCYGGTAINAILPKSMQFYKEDTDLPDYDFFSPSPDEDIKAIVKILQESWFRDIIERICVHVGTIKILVNFIPIADITYLDKKFFSILQDRAIRKDGIYYCDPDFLRAMMYLELSRPRGEVARWSKVYERLLLLNHAFPAKPKCSELPKAPDIEPEIREVILQYMINNNRILIGAEVAAVYSFSLAMKNYHSPGIQWFVRNGGAVVFITPSILSDSLEIRKVLGKDNTDVDVVKGTSEIVPDHVILRYKKRIVAILVEETACHSFNAIPLKGGKQLLIGSLDTMITFYLALHIFTNDSVRLGYSIQCLCDKMVQMTIELRRRKKKTVFPPFSITCSGYQQGISTLLRERAARILRERKKQKTRTASGKKKGGRRATTRKQGI
jgi:hypothetical protein